MKKNRRLNVIYAMLITILAMSFLTVPAYAQKGNPSQNVLVLLYHSIKDTEAIDCDKFSVYTTGKTLEKHIEMLKAAGYESLSLEQYYRKQYKSGQKYFILTFDDGYLNNYVTAFPIIKKEDVHGDIFVNTDNRDNPNYFNFEEANEMEASGLVKIYSHAPLHIDVLTKTDEEFGQLIDSSFQTLQANMEQGRCKFFAYPYGKYNKQKYKKAMEMGVCLQMVQTEKFKGKNLVYRHNICEVTDMQQLMKNGKRN